MEVLHPHQNLPKKMAIGLQSAQNNVSSKSTSSSNFRPLRRIKPDLYRLSTFRLWKTNTQCNVSPAVLSKVGFSYTGKGDNVRCDTCGLEIDSWKAGMDPKQEHMERSPQCQFVLNERDLFKKNGKYNAIFAGISFQTRHGPC